MKHKEGMKGRMKGAMDETQGGNEGGSRGQRMKHKDAGLLMGFPFNNT